jgi:hypothetical protein
VKSLAYKQITNVVYHQHIPTEPCCAFLSTILIKKTKCAAKYDDEEGGKENMGILSLTLGCTSTVVTAGLGLRLLPPTMACCCCHLRLRAGNPRWQCPVVNAPLVAPSTSVPPPRTRNAKDGCACWQHSTTSPQRDRAPTAR